MKWVGRFGAVVLVAGLAGVATAGDYHSGLNLLCSDCHTMHYSQAHAYAPAYNNGFGTRSGGAPLANGPQAYLLRDNVNNLCLSCHDNGAAFGAPDVYINNTGAFTANARNAGYLNATGDVIENAGHTLGWNTGTAPGSSAVDFSLNPLDCVSCHEQHGSANFRNLKADPGADEGGSASGLTVTYGGVADNSTDVYVRGVANEQYYEQDLDWQRPLAATGGSAIATWCGGCHEDFHGAAGDPNIGGSDAGGGDWSMFERHPVATVDIGAKSGTEATNLTRWTGATNRVKVMSPDGVWGGTTTQATPTCISCHKAHGNSNAFGLILRDRASTIATGVNSIEQENGSNLGKYEHLCAQCHVQSGSSY